MLLAIHLQQHARLPKTAQKLLLRVFTDTITASSVAKDAATLPLTMRVIAANEGACVRGPNRQVFRGTGGDWAPKGLR